MKDFSTIEISNAILHMVDTKKQKLTLSDLELSLAQGDDASSYLCNHISKSIRDASAKTARLNAGSLFKGFITQLSAAKFIHTSQQIARHLYKSSDKRISSGAVAVCLYKSPQIDLKQPFLAILKLDQSSSFQPHATNTEKGKTAISFKKVEGMVPSAGERLLKCAFFKPPKTDAWEYDLIVLDRQTSTSDEPAQFFREAFLGADFFGQPGDMTKSFYLTTTGFLEEHRSQLGNTKTEQMRSAVASALLSGETLDVVQWTNNLKLEDKIKQDLQARLTADIADTTFVIDPSIAAKLTRTRTFRGAHGFKLTIDREFVETVITGRNKQGNDTILTLKIPDFRED